MEVELDYSELPRWGTSEFDHYAALWLRQTRGVTDAAAAIWLGRLLEEQLPRVLQNPQDWIDPLVDALSAGVLRDQPEERIAEVYEAIAEADEGPGPRGLVAVSAALWAAGNLAALHAHQYPSIPVSIAERLAVILAGQARLQVASGDLSIGHDVVAKLVGTTALGRSYEELATTSAHRIVRFVVGGVWLNSLSGIRPADDVVVRGGWRGLASRLGLTSRSAAQDLKRAGEALQALSLQTPFGFERVLDATTVRIGDDVTLRLRARGPLAIGYVLKLPSGARTRALVPLRPRLPPLTGHRTSHSQQIAFEMLVLREARLRAVRSESGVLRFGKGPRPRVVFDLPDDVLAHLAQQSGLSRQNARATLEAWRTSPDAWLVRGSPGSPLHFLHGSAALMEPLISQAVDMSERGRERALKAKKRRARAAKP